MLAASLAHDIRVAFRSLLKAPALTFVVVLTLGVAIGANTAIFSVVSSVLLDPLPYPNEDRIVRVAAHPATVVDTTGAGDAFCGALATQLAGGASLAGAIRFAVGAGSAATTGEGAQWMLPAEELRALVAMTGPVRPV